MRTYFSPGTRAVYATAVLLCSGLANTALANVAEVSKADQLFQDGKRLLADEDFAHACPLLAESYQVDPATGTLLALALCHEREGKLGSALREYNEAAVRARLEARPDRERAARERALALQPRLSRLTIRTSNVHDLAELEVRVNGARIDMARLDQALPVDGGVQLIEASAKGKKAWRGQVPMAKSIDAKTVVIPALEDVPAPPSAPPSAAPVAAPAAEEVRAPRRAPARHAAESRSTSRYSDESPGLAPVQWVGIAAIGTGLVGIGVGTIFAANAITWNRDSSAGCIGDVCSADARQQRLDARSAGRGATIAFITGGALATVGVSMYLLGQRSPRSMSTERAGLSVAPWATSHEAGGVVQGQF